MRRAGLLALLFVLAAGRAVAADVLLDEAAGAGPMPDTFSHVYRFTLDDPDARLAIALNTNLRVGRGSLKMVTPSGRRVVEVGYPSRRSQYREILGPFGEPGEYLVEVAAESAAGRYRVVLANAPETQLTSTMLVQGLAAAVLAVLVLGIWLAVRRPGFRWVLAGVAVWLFGEVLKGVVHGRFGALLLPWLEEQLPRTAHVAAGAAYHFLMGGMFEMGAVVAVAVLWSGLARTGEGAAAQGVAGGAAGALFNGVGQLSNAVASVMNWAGASILLTGFVLTSTRTPLPESAFPCWAMLMLVIQAGGRTLALRSVAAGRWGPFAAAFVLVGGARAIDGTAHVADPLLPWSLWWTNLALVPLAVAGGIALRNALRDWPAPPEPAQES